MVITDFVRGAGSVDTPGVVAGCCLALVAVFGIHDDRTAGEYLIARNRVRQKPAYTRVRWTGQNRYRSPNCTTG